MKDLKKSALQRKIEKLEHECVFKAYLIGRPNFEIDAILSFIADEATEWRRTKNSTAAEELVETAGRVCYMSFGDGQSPKSNSEYIANLIKNGHDSVLEHCNWTILLTGVSRAFTHQLVRHRVGFSFSQLSQQYHSEEQANFAKPSVIKGLPEAEKIWDEAVRNARDDYTKLISLIAEHEEMPESFEVPKETLRAIRSAARSILPNATESKIVFTANARAIRHFFKLRGNIVGDEEMRLVSSVLLEMLSAEAPSLFSDFFVDYLPDGSPTVKMRESA